MIVYINGEERSVVDGSSLVDVLGEDVQNGQPRRGIAVAVNGSVVPKAQLTQALLSSGSRIEIVTAVQGG